MAQRHFLQLGLSPFLFPLSWIYACVMYLRKKLYDFKILKSYKSELPTICVGNISWGGTGKSPIVDYILTKMTEKQKKAVVLTRGYGQKSKNYPLLLNHSVLMQYNLSKNEALPQTSVQDFPQTSVQVPVQTSSQDLQQNVSQDLSQNQFENRKHDENNEKIDSEHTENTEEINDGNIEHTENTENTENSKNLASCENSKTKPQEVFVFPDEALMLIKKHPEIEILIDPNRMRAAKKVSERSKKLQDEQKGQDTIEADFLLMDDGFQHFALERDYNIVLLDKDDLFPQAPLGFLWEEKQNWNRLIPLGSWREEKHALHRASIFLLKCPERDWLTLRKHALAQLSPYQKPLFIFQIVLEGLENIFEKEPIEKEPTEKEPEKLKTLPDSPPPSSVRKKSSSTQKKSSSAQDKAQSSCNEREEDKEIQASLQDDFKKNKREYALLCAVANPEQVQKSVEDFMGYKATKTLFFADHHDFKKDYSTLYHILEDMPIICTEKDGVKLEYFEELRHAQNTIYRTKSHVQFYASEFYEKYISLSSFFPASLDSSLDASLSSNLASSSLTSSLTPSTLLPSLSPASLPESSALPLSSLGILPMSHFDHWLEHNCKF